ncbi:hypothetical protein H2198_004847 [Neophaeococcomyces mojaviensis]|uniref:Uncharacterized protein n=1 Tax=Neophaeococcomyces mojaviensis TaxID=3383035 RepID=A0ACC3A7F5_9EURO|nr:hypothetical protein H2198_004847 [Knufia sp. JES_112]
MATPPRCYLVDLPTELRLKIFDYLYKGVRAIVSYNSAYQVLLTIPQCINGSILRSCRALYDDAKVAFFANFTLHFQAEAITALQAGGLWKGEKSPLEHISHIRPYVQNININVDLSYLPHGDLMHVFRNFAHDFASYESLRQCTIRDIHVCSSSDVLQHNRVSTSKYKSMTEQERIDYFKKGNNSPAAEGVSNDKKLTSYGVWSEVIAFLEDKWLEVLNLEGVRHENAEPESSRDDIPGRLAMRERNIVFRLENELRIMVWPGSVPIHYESQVTVQLKLNVLCICTTFC